MKFIIDYKNNKYDFEWFDRDNLFEKKDFDAVAAFIFDKDGKICLIQINKDKDWTLVGGRVEDYDKNLFETLKREAIEEADIEIGNIKSLGYFESASRNDPKDKRKSARFIAQVKKILPQTIDPAHGKIAKRVFINPKDFNKYTCWGKNGNFQLKKALSVYKK
jgi:8-oxo-dGTP pyrophosphatase MutT (NUDIX family)